jgi:hypothetical protein
MLQPNYATIVLNNLDKLKETFVVDEEGNNSEGYLYRMLREYNIHLIFAPLYAVNKDSVQIAIIKSAFIILAYTNKSTWLNFTKDRYLNKKEIIASLIHDSGIQVAPEIVDEILSNTDRTMIDVINHYLAYQKDDTFFNIVALSEHISKCRNVALDNTKTMSANELKNTTGNFNELKTTQQNLSDLIKLIKTKYSDLDEVMKREGRTAFTEELDLTNYETRLRYIMENNLFQKESD